MYHGKQISEDFFPFVATTHNSGVGPRRTYGYPVQMGLACNVAAIYNHFEHPSFGTHTNKYISTHWKKYKGEVQDGCVTITAHIVV